MYSRTGFTLLRKTSPPVMRHEFSLKAKKAETFCLLCNSLKETLNYGLCLKLLFYTELPREWETLRKMHGYAQENNLELDKKKGSILLGHAPVVRCS